MDRSSTVLAACTLFSLWACTRDPGAAAVTPLPGAATAITAGGARAASLQLPAAAPVSFAVAGDAVARAPATQSAPRAEAPIAVPQADDARLDSRQSPVVGSAAAAATSAPLPDNSDIGYRCEDGGLLRVVYTQSHANVSLDGVFLPLQPWRQESLRTGAEAWAGEHVALVRRGDVVDLREADGDQRRCRVHAAAGR